MFKGISYKNIDRKKKNGRKKDEFRGDGIQRTAL